MRASADRRDCDGCGAPALYRSPDDHEDMCEQCATWRAGEDSGVRYAAARALSTDLAAAVDALGESTVRQLLVSVLAADDLANGIGFVSDVPNVGSLAGGPTDRLWRAHPLPARSTAVPA